MRYNCIVYYIYCMYITLPWVLVHLDGLFCQGYRRQAIGSLLNAALHVPRMFLAPQGSLKKDMVEKAKRSQSESAKMWILQAKNTDRLLFPVCSMGWCDWNKVKVVCVNRWLLYRAQFLHILSLSLWLFMKNPACWFHAPFISVHPLYHIMLCVLETLQP